MKVNERLFWAKVEKRGPDECWEWQGSRRDKGYGRFAIARAIVGAHRASWMLHFGPIPAGQGVLHSCDNPPCVNPAHLFLGTVQDNHADMMRKGRNGHGELVHPRGSDHPNAKLDEATVRTIRAELARGVTQTAIAKRLGITQSHVSQVASRRLWGHVQ